jgi:2-polyprenyl-3-methyl-5-hydroxy-6-metoxy-1,4-benzoquinol methylase
VNHGPACLGCGAPLTRTVVDLGVQPLANSYLRSDQASVAEPTYPLHVRVCDACLLVQVDRVVPPEAIFNDYAYFSSFSESWLAHVRAYVAMAMARFDLGPTSKVVEIASNDGYLLQFVIAAGVPCLGVEPAANVAATARAKGVPTEVAFFGRHTAERLLANGHAADLIICKNVLAHVPDINDFTSGIAVLLRPEGVHTVEFPHLLNLLAGTQFDTIYHEHFTYLSLLAVITVFARHGLRVFDVQEVPTHGGSLRLFVCRNGASHVCTATVAQILDRERAAGLDGPRGYAEFETRMRRVRCDFVDFLDGQRAAGLLVAGYGAAAKGNTLLNYCGIGPERLAFVADRSPAKQSMLLPGSHIPVVAPEAIDAERPDFIVILPWNIRAEVIRQLAHVRSWGARFVTAIPHLLVED